MVVSLECKQNGVYTVRKKSRFQQLYKDNKSLARNTTITDLRDAESKVVSIRDCAGTLIICAKSTKSLRKPEVALNLKTMVTQKNNVRGRKATSIYLIQFLL